MIRFLLILFFAFLGFVVPVSAQDKKEAPTEEIQNSEDAEEEEIDYTETDLEPVRFAPDHCDFEITLPSEPAKTKRCPAGGDTCYDLTTYTMVYDMSTTVEASVTCIPSAPSNFNRYNERVIRAALKGMVERAQIDEYKINTDSTRDSRQGSLIGTGTYGKHGRIYNAQLWVGLNSVLTIEAKLTGKNHGQADEAFSQIIGSIQEKRPESELEPAAGKETKEPAKN